MDIKAECQEVLPCKLYKKGWLPGLAGKCTGPDFNYCVNDFTKNMTTISHTAKEEFVHCRFAFFLRYIMGINQRDDQLGDALVAGRLWDEFVGAFHGSGKSPAWPEDISDLLRIKLRALTKAHQEFIKPDLSTGFKAQAWIKLQVDGVQVAGAVDRAYDDHFVETKLSMKPDFYLKPHNMTSQLGTYFLSNPKWEYAVMEVTRMPTMYMKKDDDPNEYYRKLYGDIVSRPSYYFPGLNRKKGTFGLRLDRSDINIERVEKEYKMIIGEMRECLKNRGYYHQYASCHHPYECSYLPICTTDTLSETLYTTGGKR